MSQPIIPRPRDSVEHRASRAARRWTLAVIFAAATQACAMHEPHHDRDGCRPCEKLVTDYAYYRDRLDAARVAALFTADAELSVLGTTWRGRDAIRARFDETASRTRHMMSTVHIERTGSDTASGTSYITVYSAAADADEPAPVSAFAAVGEYRDQFRLTAEGWRIASREFVPVFVPQPETN